MANLNLEQILELFQNGPRRYEEDPAFKAVIDSLKMGLGVYGVLDHVLKEKREVTIIAHNLRANYDAVIKSVGVLQKSNTDLQNSFDLILEERNTVIDQRDAHELNIDDLNDQIKKLKDEVASWKDANEGLRELNAEKTEDINRFFLKYDDYQNGDFLDVFYEIKRKYENRT